MLRVRPIHHTAKMASWTQLLTSLGLTLTDDDGNWRLFTSGNGNVGLQFAEPGSELDGHTSLGFEVRDCEIFVRRTQEDGTRAELIESAQGLCARVTAPNGFSFTVDPVTDLSLSDPAEKLAVAQIWHGQDTVEQQKVLADIGARQIVPHNARFAAKNGGFTAVHHGPQDAVELSFDYGGPVKGLAQQLALSGIHGQIIEQDLDVFLLLDSPDDSNVKLRVKQHRHES